MLDIEMLLGRAGIGIVPALLAPVSIVVGLLALLYGYRLVRLFIFLTGFAIGTVVLSLFTEVPVAILGGLLVGVICCALWVLGVFVLGAVVGVLLIAALGVDEQTVFIFGALLFGLLAVIIQKFMVIILTSWSGANLIVPVAAGLIGGGDMLTEFAVTVAVTIVGIVCQYTVTSGKKRESIPVASTEERHLEECKAEDQQRAGNHSA